jgi:hypothetical protein
MKLTSEWRKSTHSGGEGACVEVRRTGDRIEVRDTKDRSGPVLGFTEKEWTAFTEGVRHDEFDL